MMLEAVQTQEAEEGCQTRASKPHPRECPWARHIPSWSLRFPMYKVGQVMPAPCNGYKAYIGPFKVPGRSNLSSPDTTV